MPKFHDPGTFGGFGNRRQTNPQTKTHVLQVQIGDGERITMKDLRKNINWIY